MFSKRSILFLWFGLMMYAAMQAWLVSKSSPAPFWGAFLNYFFIECCRLACIYALLRFSERSIHHWNIGQQVLMYALWVLIISGVLVAVLIGFIVVWASDVALNNIWNIKHWIFLQNVLENGLLVAAFVVLRFRREIKEQKERERELRNLNTQMELAALRAQLNPHFLFNALNVVNALIGVNPDEARRVLETLSDLLRYTLESDKQAMVSLREELDFVRKYLLIEQARFGKRLQYRIEADETLLDTSIPPMLLQPLVENAVKHGISPKASGGEVCVSIMRDKAGEGLSVEVRDNGVGLQHSINADSNSTHSTGIGLANTSARLQKLFGEKSTPKIQSNNDENGVTVCFWIPFLLRRADEIRNA